MCFRKVPDSLRENGVMPGARLRLVSTRVRGLLHRQGRRRWGPELKLTIVGREDETDWRNVKEPN